MRLAGRGRERSVLGLVVTAVMLAFWSSSAAASTTLPSTISQDMTLTAAGSPYTSTGSVTIAAGVTVTAEPGAKVQIGTSSAHGLSVNGTLNAQGTAADPVVITSGPDSAAGQWSGVTLNSSSSTLDHAEIRFAKWGITTSGAITPQIANSTIRDNSFAGVQVSSGGSPRITDDLIQRNQQGVYVINGGAPEIARNTITDNRGQGVYYVASYNTTGQTNIHDNDVERNGGTAGIDVYADANSTLSPVDLSDNTLRDNTGQALRYQVSVANAIPADILQQQAVSGNGSNAVWLSGKVTGNTAWNDPGYPIVIIGGYNLTVFSGAALTLGPGLVLKGETTTSRISASGNLVAQGTSANPVTLTSLKDDSIGGDTNGDGSASQPAPGDWGYLYLGSSDTGTLDHFNVSYGGSTVISGYTMINMQLAGSNPARIINSKISNSKTTAAYIYGDPGAGAPAPMARDTFRNNPAAIGRTSGALISAPNNDYDCVSGPQPAGCGEFVSALVDAKPWDGPAGSHCEGQKTQCRPGGDPVSLATGDFTYAHTDLELTGKGMTLEFARSYNSGDASDAGLGPGWSHSGLLAANEKDSGDVVIRRADGRRDTFAKVQGAYVSPSGITDALVKNPDGTFKLTTLDRTIYRFNSSGRIASITDDHGLATTYGYDSNGRLSSISDASGQSLAFAYNSSNHITKVQDSAGRHVDFTYDSSGNLATATDPLGGVTDYGYDSQHRLTQITDPAGNTFVTNTYDGQGRIQQQHDALGNFRDYDYSSGQTEVTQPTGGTETYHFDADGRVSSETDALGHTTSFGYSAAGILNEITRPGGAIWNLSHDGAGNLDRITDPEGGERSYSYDGQNRVTSMTDPRGKIWSYDWSTANDLMQITDPNSGTWAFTYNSAGQPLTVTDPESHTTTYGYDSRGNLTSASDQLNHTTTYGYNSHNFLTSLTRPNLPAETYGRNALGDLLSQTTPLGHTTTYAYDPDGQLTQITDPNQNPWQIHRNAMELPTKIIDPLLNETQIAYDANQNPTGVTDRRGHTTTYTYDHADQLTALERPAGGTYGLGYNGRGDLSSLTDPLGHTTTYTYDGLDQLTEADEPLQATTHYGYNPTGDVTSIVDPMGHETDLVYDALGRLTTVDQPLGEQTSYSYDGAGNETSRTTAAGTVGYTYDAANRITDVTDGQDVLRAYAYDDANRLTEAIDAQGTPSTLGYDADSRLTTIDDGLGQTVSRGYDSAGNLTSQTDGRGTISYTYDELNRISSLTDPWGSAQSFAYNVEGQLIEAELANGAITTNAFDQDGNMTQTQTTKATDVLQSFDYGYNAADQVTSQTDQSNGQTTYAYDALGRLTQFDSPSQPATAYSYNAAGNRTAAGGTTYDYNALNQLTHASDGTDYTYDGAGRLTQTSDGAQTRTYDWNELDQLTAFNDGSQSITYTYDAQGRPSGRTDSAGTTISHYGDLTDAPIFDTGPSGGILGSYIASPSTGQEPQPVQLSPFQSGEGSKWVQAFAPDDRLSMLEERSGGSTTYPLANAHGDVTTVLDDAGAVSSRQGYDPWGDQLSGSPRQMGYLGVYERRTDPDSGLVQMGIRQYDPTSARFLTEDPVLSMVAAGQSLDHYGYVWGDPLNLYDLSGRTVVAMPPSKEPGPIQNGFADIAHSLSNLCQGSPGDLEDPCPGLFDRGEAPLRDLGSRIQGYACPSNGQLLYGGSCSTVDPDIAAACASGALYFNEIAPEIAALPDGPLVLGLLGCGAGAAAQHKFGGTGPLPPVTKAKAP